MDVLAVTVTGLPALLIILVILALLAAGAFTLIRSTARGARKIADGATSNESRAPRS